MSLKVFVSNTIGFIGAEDGTCVVGGAVMDSTTGTVLSLGEGNPVYITGTTVAVYGDTLSTIKAKLVLSMRSFFEDFTGRTDGEILTFVWLDDKGIL